MARSVRVNHVETVSAGEDLSSFVDLIPSDTGAASTNATRLQAAIDAIPGNVGGVVRVDRGTFYLNETITVQNRPAIRIIGEGTGLLSGSQFVWNGANTKPMWLILNSSEFEMSDASLFSGSSNPCTALIESRYNSTLSATLTVTRNRFTRLYFHGQSQSVKGSLYSKTNAEGNNDFGLFQDCIWANFATAGISIEAAQSRGHRFDNCRLVGNAVGLSTALGSGVLGGDFIWSGGGSGGNTIPFDLGNPQGPVVIDNMTSEADSRFIRMNSGGSSIYSLTVRGCRVAPANFIAANKKVFILTGKGPFVFLSNQIGGGASDAGLILEITCSVASYLELRGNQFNAWNSSVVDPVVFAGGGSLTQARSSNSFTDAGGLPV